MTTRTDTVMQHQIFSRSWGPTELDSATAIVLLHGLSVSSKYMIPLGEALGSRGFPTFAPDMPGYGDSSKPIRTLQTKELGDVLSTWMAAIGITKAIVVANSYGCQIAAEASTTSESLKHIVMVGAVDDRVQLPLRHVLRGARDARHERWWDLRTRPADAHAMGLRSLLRTLKILTAHKISIPLAASGVPITVVRGEHDPISPDAWGRRLVDQFSAVPLITVAGCGHDVHAKRFDFVADLAEETAKKV